MKRQNRTLDVRVTSINRRCRPASLLPLALLALLLAGNGATAQQSAAPSTGLNRQQEIDAFELSEFYDLRQNALFLIRDGQLKQAERQLRAMIDAFPQMPGIQYLLAAVLVRQNNLDAAFDRLTIAIRRGFSDLNLILSDPALEPLRRQERFQSLMGPIGESARNAVPVRPRKVSPAVVRGGVALVTEDNTSWDPKRRILKSEFLFGPKATVPGEVQRGKGTRKVLNEWYSKGLAAGNSGDLYDNHDRNHSGGTLIRSFPQMTSVKYGPRARAAGVDYGLNTRMSFNAITIGNSSTVAERRSQARHALTLPGIPNILYRQYVGNQLYVYPEHQDYDPGRGDLLPANTPYVIVSQGSSGSDAPFLVAVTSILAAFRPDVKDYLRTNHLVMPTVQMILRRGQKTVKTDADYLSAKAHPPVFKPENIDLPTMINLAHRMKIEDVPPMVHLRTVEESGPQPGVDDFSVGVSEILFDTPGAIARVIRSTAYEKRMVIRAESTGKSSKPDDRYDWVVLSGDKDRIKINKRNENGSEVELIVPWHERRAVPGIPGMTTDRVEIGVFASSGKYHSAPAFINFLYPANQKRKYNDRHQIVSIDHDDPNYTKRYLEPRLFVRRNWADVYKYDATSSLLTGWQRRRGKWVSNYTRDGAKISQWDDQGRATEARSVRYKIERDKQGISRIVEVPGATRLFYHYDGDKDRTGKFREERIP